MNLLKGLPPNDPYTTTYNTNTKHKKYFSLVRTIKMMSLFIYKLLSIQSHEEEDVTRKK